MKEPSSRLRPSAAGETKSRAHEASVPRSTVVWVAAAAFVLGFLAGVVLAVYKGTSPGSMPAVASKMPIVSKAQEDIDRIEAEALKNPQDAQGWIHLGNACFDADLPEKAIAAYEKALGIDEKNPNVWTDLGVMYRRVGQFDLAIAAFDKAFSLDPRHEPSLFNKGIVLMHDKNDVAGAIAAWEKLLAINPLATAPGGKSIDELLRMLKKGKE